MVDFEIKSFDDLWDSRLAGMVSIPEITTTFGPAMVYMASDHAGVDLSLIHILEQFDFSVEEAAWSLGCPKGAAFFKVVLPNVTSGISSAFMLAFINSFNNIPVSMFLSGPGVSTFPSTLI